MFQDEGLFSKRNIIAICFLGVISLIIVIIISYVTGNAYNAGSVQQKLSITQTTYPSISSVPFSSNIYLDLPSLAQALGSNIQVSTGQTIPVYSQTLVEGSDIAKALNLSPIQGYEGPEQWANSTYNLSSSSDAFTLTSLKKPKGGDIGASAAKVQAIKDIGSIFGINANELSPVMISSNQGYSVGINMLQDNLPVITDKSLYIFTVSLFPDGSLNTIVFYPYPKVNALFAQYPPVSVSQAASNAYEHQNLISIISQTPYPQTQTSFLVKAASTQSADLEYMSVSGNSYLIPCYVVKGQVTLDATQLDSTISSTPVVRIAVPAIDTQYITATQTPTPSTSPTPSENPQSGINTGNAPPSSNN